MSFGEIITWPFAKLMVLFYNLTNSYGLALILFSLTVNLVLMPFMAKSKKSMMRTTRLQPRIQELQRRHEGNQQKLNAEMQKLYQEEGFNPASGCLWSLLPLFLLFPLYSIIRLPITRMMMADASVVDSLSELFTEQVSNLSARAAGYKEIILTNLAHANWSSIPEELRPVPDPLYFRGPVLGVHEGLHGHQPHHRRRPVPEHEQEHEHDDASHERCVLLHDARRHGHLLDLQQRLRHGP